MNEQAYAYVDDGFAKRSGASRMPKKPWSVYEIGAVLGGFVAFWPLGLAALYLKHKKGELWNGASDMQAPWQNWKSPRDAAEHFSGNFKRRDWQGFSNTGNQAFDEYRKVELEKLEAMRRKLEKERKSFDEFLSKMRHAKDREDFDRFMAEKNAPTNTAN
jgi:Protein of unknown function (DUF2852)